jgi:allophanate hydrolase subunit 2
VKILPGPDARRFSAGALEAFLSADWTISAKSDRVGIRLEGPAIERVDEDLAVSAPMVRGAVQVPKGGAPIVLGPDHPTTGGYPVLAVVASSDWGTLAMLRAGEKVRFRA